MSEQGRDSYDVVCFHGNIKSICEECTIEQVRRSEQTLRNLEMSKSCTHSVEERLAYPNACSECMEINRAQMEKEREAFLNEKYGHLKKGEPCFHGIVGICEQCQQIFERKQEAATSKISMYPTRYNDKKEQIMSLLKIAMAMLEDLLEEPV